MIWCRYQAGGDYRYGLVEDGIVSDVEGSPFADYHRTGRTYPLDAVRLGVPVVPDTFFCMGVNYAEHVRLRSEQTGRPGTLPTRPEVGYRANSALIATGEPIIKPADAGPHLQYEGELVAVMGRDARNVSAVDALDYVLGWTIGNDVSERDWQAEDRTLWRSKNADTFKPMGPWIVTDLDQGAMTTTVRVNGEVTDQFPTSNMLFGVAECIAEITRYITMRAGDVLWMGTDGLPRDIGAGDTVDVEISGIGVLTNPVIAAG
jgi:2-keto-4-pentenoate hydratase/2-oxohepta-3-ene-1,7-dioic acid hydratase in catechol pathway